MIILNKIQTKGTSDLVCLYLSVSPIIDQSFDTLVNLTLKVGYEESNFTAQVEGQVRNIS